MSEFKLFMFIVINPSGLNFVFLFCVFYCDFPFIFLFSAALFELTVLSLFLFIFHSTDLEVTYSICLLFIVWILSDADYGKHSQALNAPSSVGLMAFSSVLTPGGFLFNGEGCKCKCRIWSV